MDLSSSSLVNWNGSYSEKQKQKQKQKAERGEAPVEHGSSSTQKLATEAENARASLEDDRAALPDQHLLNGDSRTIGPTLHSHATPSTASVKPASRLLDKRPALDTLSKRGPGYSTKRARRTSPRISSPLIVEDGSIVTIRRSSSKAQDNTSVKSNDKALNPRQGSRNPFDSDWEVEADRDVEKIQEELLPWDFSRQTPSEVTYPQFAQLFNSSSPSATPHLPRVDSLFTPDPTPPPINHVRMRMSHVELPRLPKSALEDYKPMKKSRLYRSPKKKAVTPHQSSQSFRQQPSPSRSQPISKFASQPRRRLRPRSSSVSTRLSSPMSPTVPLRQPFAKANTSIPKRQNGQRTHLSIDEALNASLAHNATLGSLSPTATHRSSKQMENGVPGPSKVTKSASVAVGVKRKSTEEEGTKKKKKQKVDADREAYSPSKQLRGKSERSPTRSSPRKTQKSPQRQPLSNLPIVPTLPRSQLDTNAYVQFNEEEDLLDLYFDIVPLIEEEVLDENLSHLKTGVSQKAGVEITYRQSKGKEKEGVAKPSQGPVEAWFAELQKTQLPDVDYGLGLDEGEISVGSRVWAWFDHPSRVYPDYNNHLSQNVDDLEDDVFLSVPPTKSKATHKRRRSGGLPGDSVVVPIEMDEDDGGDGVNVGSSPSKTIVGGTSSTMGSAVVGAVVGSTGKRKSPSKPKERTKERSPVKTRVNGVLGAGAFVGDGELTWMGVQTSEDFLEPAEQEANAPDLSSPYDDIMSPNLFGDDANMFVQQMEDLAQGPHMDLTANYPSVLDDVGISMNTLENGYNAYATSSHLVVPKNALRPHAPADASLFPSPPPSESNQFSKSMVSPDDLTAIHPWSLDTSLLSPGQMQLFGNGTIDPSLLLSEQDRLLEQDVAPEPSPSPVIRRVQHDHGAGVVTIRKGHTDAPVGGDDVAKVKGKQVIRYDKETKPDGVAGRSQRIRKRPRKFDGDMVASTSLRLSASPSPSLSPSLGEGSSRPSRRPLPSDLSPIIIPDTDSDSGYLPSTSIRSRYAALVDTSSNAKKRSRSSSVSSVSSTASSTSYTSSLLIRSRAASKDRQQSNAVANAGGNENDCVGVDKRVVKGKGPAKPRAKAVAGASEASTSQPKAKAKVARVSNGPGVRKRKNVVEWPTATEAYFCHHCRTKSFKTTFACASCPKRYCCRCLTLKYDPPVQPDPTSLIWNCPACDDFCTCDICTRRRGEVYVSFRTGKPADPPPSWVPPKSVVKEATAELEEVWVPSPDLNELEKVPVDKPLYYWAAIYGFDGEAVGGAYTEDPQVPMDTMLVALPLHGESSFRKPKDHRVEVPVKRTTSSKRAVTATPAPDKRRRRVYVGEVPPCWKFGPSAQGTEINPAPKADRKSWNQRWYVGDKDMLFMKCELRDEDYEDADMDAEGDTDVEEDEDVDWTNTVHRFGPPGMQRTENVPGLGDDPMSPLTELDEDSSSIQHQSPYVNDNLVNLRASVPLTTPPIAAHHLLPVGTSPLGSWGSSTSATLGNDEFASHPEITSGSATVVGDSPVESPIQCVTDCAAMGSNEPIIGTDEGSSGVDHLVIMKVFEATGHPYQLSLPP